MRYRGVVFDLFGTLIDVFTLSEYERVVRLMATTLEVDSDAFVEAWKESGPMRGDGTFVSGQDNICWCLDRLEVERDAALIDEAIEHRLALCRRWIVPHDDVLPTVRSLRQSGVKVGLLSNCAREISQVWAETAFDGVFDGVVLSCDVGMRKPKLEIFQLACERIGILPSECLYVGDGDDFELEGAAEAGLHPVLIRHEKEVAEDVFRRHSADDWAGPRIARISEVPELIGGE